MCRRKTEGVVLEGWPANHEANKSLPRHAAATSEAYRSRGEQGERGGRTLVAVVVEVAVAVVSVMVKGSGLVEDVDRGSVGAGVGEVGADEGTGVGSGRSVVTVDEVVELTVVPVTDAVVSDVIVGTVDDPVYVVKVVATHTPW